MSYKRVIIVGPGGSGKDHLINLLSKEGLVRAVSCTTRPPRIGELNGKDYHFISEEEFQRLIDADKFIEWYSFGDFNWRYGTTKKDFKSSNVFIMSPPVIRTLPRAIRDEAIVIYLSIHVDIRRRRLEARSDADSVQRRLDADFADFSVFTDWDILIQNPEFTVADIISEINKKGWKQ